VSLIEVSEQAPLVVIARHAREKRGIRAKESPFYTMSTLFQMVVVRTDFLGYPN
jgi:hypothetical protein